jgi:hypothetical protein
VALALLTASAQTSASSKAAKNSVQRLLALGRVWSEGARIEVRPCPKRDMAERAG